MATKKTRPKRKAATAKKPKSGIPDSLLSGSEAIRRIIATGKTKTADIVAAVKTSYNQDVKPGLVSAVKQKQSITKPRSGNGKDGRKIIRVGNGHAVARGNGGGNVVTVISAAADFVRLAGGFDNAKQMLAVIETIKA